MALSLQGWLNGLSASGLVIFGCAFGLFFIYKSRKTNAKLLFYWGIGTIFLGLCWLGELVDFLTILLTGKNMVNPYNLHALICFMWVPIVALFWMYIVAELLVPEKKWYIVGIIVALGIFYELFIFIDPIGSFTVVYPDKPGEDLINDSLAFGSPAFIFATIILLSSLILGGFGLIYKTIQSTGVLRKKFLLLSIGAFLITMVGSLDALTSSGVARFLLKISMIGCYWVYYLGLREASAEPKKVRPKKEVKVEGDLFRITKRPEQITEEEVSISKEKKICLVCKGKVGKIMFMCPNCETFYCINCSEALSNLENACWVCDNPFDDSKPVKPFKKEEEIEVEVSEKSQKKPKTKK